MKRTRSKTSTRLSPDTERLITMSIAAIASGGRAESNYWNVHLETLLATLMDRGNNAAIEAALEQTFQTNQLAHEVVAANSESAAESCLVAVNGVNHHAMLISIPMVAWSKYQIASGKVDPALIAPVQTHLQAHVLASGADICLNPFLYSIDQLPRGFSETRKLLKKMADAAVNKEPATIAYAKLGDSAELPADVRFLLGVVVVPVVPNVPYGTPHFRWQEMDANDNPITNRTACLAEWVEQGRPHLAKLLHGAEFECGLPDAYFRNCRESDLRVRRYTISSTVSILVDALHIAPSQLSAIVAGVGDAQTDEYRVSFTRKGQGDVYQGVVWPLYGSEDDDANPAPNKEIEAILRASNVTDITILPGILPPEFCEDCGAPLFFNHDAEAVHAEMPDDSGQVTPHYH